MKKITCRHHKAAESLMRHTFRVDEAARAVGVRPETLRRWLEAPAFRALVEEKLREPLAQARAALRLWAPAAAARLIAELESESASEARQAAREVLRLGVEPLVPAPPPEPKTTPEDDPLAKRLAALPDEAVGRMLEIIGKAGD